MRKPILASGARRTRTIRSTAALLGILLVFGSLAPPLALAKHESDTEGEGTSAPGALPGLEIGTGHEPTGEETALSEESVGPEESEIEEEVPAPEVEEPEPEALESTPPPAPESPTPPEPEVVVPVEAAPAPVTEPAPPPETPSYGPEPSPPNYEPSPSVSSPPGEAVVQNETITGDTGQPQVPPRKSPHLAAPASPTVVAEPEPAPEVPAAPGPSPAPPAVIPAAPSDRAGSLAGRNSHLVAAGECLWTIAEAYLPAGASNSEIAAEVHRLWRLNAERIGTGDPDMLPIGVNLRLA
ncbi:MAG: hypothetical protein J0H06_02345 [Actinobacteria bacterium]|nr:hypothetical protein [Actinomycetota bacterium]